MLESIFNACVQGDINRVNKLIDQKGVEIINERDNSGYIALHYASRNNHYDICDILIRKGSNVNTATYSCKSTPLHRAAYMANIEIIKLLLKNKADPFLKDIDGRTSVHKSVEMLLFSLSNKNSVNKCLQTIKILLDKYPLLINETDNKNKTILDYYPDLLSELNKLD
jgi:hypothetical protein